jgi:hypothetical protein
MLLTGVREVLGSNLSGVANYHEENFMIFYRLSRRRLIYLQTRYDSILSNSVLAKNQIIRQCTLRATGSQWLPYLLTCLLSVWNWIVLERLLVVQPLQNSPSILWNPLFNTALTRAFQLVSVLSQTNPVHTNPSYLCKILLNVPRLHPYVLHAPPISSSSTWSF